MQEVGMDMLLGRPLRCGLAHVGEGEHEDVGTGRELVNKGESEMEKWLKQNGDEVRAWDDVTGKALDAKMVWEARRLEMDFFRQMGGVSQGEEELGESKRGENNRG